MTTKHEHIPRPDPSCSGSDGHHCDRCDCGAIRVTLVTGYVASWYEPVRA